MRLLPLTCQRCCFACGDCEHPLLCTKPASLCGILQLGWNVILCKMSSVSVVRQHSARRYTEKRLPDQLQMGLLDRRPSGALQMRSAGSLRPHSAEEVRYKAPIEGISPYRSDNAARI